MKGDRRIGRAGEAADRRNPWNLWDSQRRDRDQRGVVRVRVDVVGLGRDLQGVLLGDAVAERVADNCRVREAERDDDAFDHLACTCYKENWPLQMWCRVRL